jgi:L-threonylcarbamoyladenylate synthase
MRDTDPLAGRRIVDAHDDDALERAVSILRAGGLVALPTETVYGLAADPRQPEALRNVFRVKGRPADHPLILHVESVDRVYTYASSVSSLARDAIATFWPGPLTVLLRRTNSVSDLVTGGRDTVAVRCPANVFFRSVIENVDSGLAAPSANRFGHVSPTRAQHVVDDLGSSVDLVVDDGPCKWGLESTIIDLTTAEPQILRAGAISQEDLEDILDVKFQGSSGPSRASGMLASHYAPRASVLLAKSLEEARQIEGEFRENGGRIRILEHVDDLPMYAATLYSQLRQADYEGCQAVVAVVPPPIGLGSAIVDRLMKASVKPYGQSD